MHQKQIRRRRLTFFVLVSLSIVLLTVYFGEKTSGTLHAIQRGAMEVFAPLQEGASRALKPGSDLTDWVDESLEAKDENRKLRGELLDLRLKLARAEGAVDENKELRALATFDRSRNFPVGVRAIGARVIVRSPTNWFGRIHVDKGSSSGVKVDQPVIAGDGLVGRVTSVSAHAAQVTLINDPESGVTAQVQPSGALGVVRSGGGDELVLDFIRDARRIRRGNTVVTSGTVTSDSEINSIFPRGIPIGRVTKVDVEEREIYQRVHIESYVDVRDVNMVQVLIERQG